MNDVLQQLLQVAPGIGAGVSGNGPGMQAFMEAYQRTSQMLDQRDMQQQTFSQQQADRTRQQTRQTEQDRIAAEDRQRKITLEGMQVGPALAEQASALDDPDAAKAFIEQALPGLMKVYGQDIMGQGQPAVNMAQAAITGRQRSELTKWVKDELLPSQFLQESRKQNPGSDVVVDLTSKPRMADILGRAGAIAPGAPSIPLSKLLEFTGSLEPAARTRTPPAAGSMEEFSDPSITPERKAQILADRKAYMQSDDKPTVQVHLPGGISGKAGDAALKFQDDYARDSKPYLLMREAYQRVKSAKPDAAGDLSLIFAYMKILDPNSVVREQEFANAQNAAGVPDRVRNMYNKVMQGTRLAPDQRQQFLSQAEALFEGAKTNQRHVRGTYSGRAKQWGIPDGMVLDEEDEFLRGQPTPKTPQIGARVRDKKTGNIVEVTGVRPDGSLIVKPVSQ